MDHAPDAHAPHSHGHAHRHDHPHDHDHHHHDASDFYLQQLLTIFICGAFGVAGILMCVMSGGVDQLGQPITKIGALLVPGFHPWVMLGSILLLAVTAIRGVALWRSAGATAHAHDHHGHDHKPGEACDHPSHAHDHHGHDHDHGDHSAEDHDHGNVYWRVVVLLLPIVILVMGLPNGTFSNEYLLARVNGNAVGELGDVADRGSTDVGFETLATAAYSPQSRDAFTGQTATVSGKLKKLSEKQFTLFFYKMTCCTADQVPLKATCVVKDKAELETFRDADNVRVTGRIQFAQDSTSGEWVTVLRVDKGGVVGR